MSGGKAVVRLMNCVMRDPEVSHCKGLPQSRDVSIVLSLQGVISATPLHTLVLYTAHIDWFRMRWLLSRKGNCGMKELERKRDRNKLRSALVERKCLKLLVLQAKLDSDLNC